MIFDCFSYFNEDLILDLRLNTLDKFVDKFVIVEATKDHAGRNRKLNFQIENLRITAKLITCRCEYRTSVGRRIKITRL